jgi:hypothetical protein
MYAFGEHEILVGDRDPVQGPSIHTPRDFLVAGLGTCAGLFFEHRDECVEAPIGASDAAERVGGQFE